MPVSNGNLLFCKAATMAVDFSTPTIGGAKNVSAVITGGTPGEVFFTMNSLETGGGSLIQGSKTFMFNSHTTDSVAMAGAYWENVCVQITANGHIAFQSTSNSDNSTREIYVMGYDVSGLPQSESVTLNGTSLVYTLGNYSKAHRGELHLVAGGLTVAIGNISAIDAAPVQMGTMVAGLFGITWEVDFLLGTSIDDSITAADAAHPPAGSYIKPNTLATVALVPSVGYVLTFGQGCAVWQRLTLDELALPSATMQVSGVMVGSAV